METDKSALDELPTEELRHRAFAIAMKRHDTEALDASLGAVGASVADAVALWRELTGHGYGENEPLLRAAFVDYLIEHDPGNDGSA